MQFFVAGLLAGRRNANKGPTGPWSPIRRREKRYLNMLFPVIDDGTGNPNSARIDGARSTSCRVNG